MKRNLMIMMVLILAFFAININAAVFLVNTTSDTQDANPGNGICADAGGNCSLRAAITEANALAGADTINLPPGVYTHSLVSAGDNNNAGGDFDINSDLTITGNDPLTTIVQANASPGVATERVFHVRFISAGMVVNLGGLTIQNGRNAGNVFGAGIRLDAGAGTLNLNNAIVKDNRNASSGGGISLSGAAGSTLNITNSTISDNIAGSTTAGTSGTGGGIHINNSPAFLNINNSTISNNTATSGITFGLGGGIGCNGTVNIENSTISGNTAFSSVNSAFGGGLYIPSGTTTVTNTTVSNNNATSTAGGAFFGAGGGVLNLNSNLIIISALFEFNVVSHFHAGIRTLASTGPANTTIRSSTVRNNSAPNEGGGVANISGASFDATTNIENSTINGNTTTGPSSLGGGFLNFSSGTGTARGICLNATISGNSAAGSSGNIHNQRNSGNAIFDVNFCTIVNGNAPVVGGVNNVGGQVNLKNSIVAGSLQDLGGTIISQNYNHIQNPAGATITPMSNDVFNTDPMLGPLQDNGGNTLTHEPVGINPVTNTIPNKVNGCGDEIEIDQRFFTRPDSLNSTHCDKGSVEADSSAPPGSFCDFDGDGQSDYALTRNVGPAPSGTLNQMRWFVGLGCPPSFGRGNTGKDNFPSNNLNCLEAILNLDLGDTSTDTPAPEDYDGDGKTDFAVWRPVSTGQPANNGFFFIFESETGTLRIEPLGQIGDIVIPLGDIDGDGIADTAVYRPGGGLIGGQSFFYYRGSQNNPNGNITFVPWGQAGDTPLPGDFDGDGRQDFTIRRPLGDRVENWTLFANGGFRVINFGLPTDKPVTGDFDGDRKNDLAIIRNVGGSMQWWYLSSINSNTVVVNFGLATDFPTPADYDGDGRTDLSTFRPSATAGATAFWVRNSSSGNVFTIPFGQMGDYPVASRGITPLVP